MSSERRILWGVIFGVALVVVVIMSIPEVEKRAAPAPRAAWVAVETAASPLARTGDVQILAGMPFRLHAVLEAESWTGKTVYFTEAEQLELEGRRIPASALRRWSETEEARILWFTVEGFTPYMEVREAPDLARFRFEEFFRADWPRAWSVPGSLQPRRELPDDSVPLDDLPRFGTQRFHVRIELFGPESRIAPRARIQSMRASELPATASRFTTVTATLPGPLELPSRVFGLTQIEPLPGALPQVAERLVSWSRDRIAFSRVTVLGELLERSGVAFGDLSWESVDLAAGPAWGEQGVLEGDLLRVGDRWLIVFLDRGLPGVLDREDLTLDFGKGARVRKVEEIFTGEGLVDWARLPGGSATTPE